MARDNLGKLRDVSVGTIMRRPAFMAGVEDAAIGLKLDATSWSSKRDQWDYERGRLWAIATGRQYVTLRKGHPCGDDVAAYCRCMSDGTFPQMQKMLPTADELGL